MDEFSLSGLVDFALELLKENEPPGGYYGCFSGGKDSVVIKHLAKMAGVNVHWHYNVTTIDPPELVRFIGKQHSDVAWEKPKHGNFFRRMEVRGFPTRRGRWCCEEYKEACPPRGSILILGIRAEESSKRAKMWQSVTFHIRTKAIAVLPIFHWPSDELWQFINAENIPYSELYNEGFHRLGCIGCPMAREKGRRKEFARWPGYERCWKLSFKRIWEKRAGRPQKNGKEWFGSYYFNNWQEVWEWWLCDKPLPVMNEKQTEMEWTP